jgi:putative tryptophan/tyrosine transport system substrate-binding protein
MGGNAMTLGLALSLALALIAAPLVGEAQQAGNVPRIALVISTSSVAQMLGSDPIHPHIRAFVHALRDLGYVEGRNILITRRSAEGKPERLPDIFAELIRDKVDVIVTATTPVVRAAKQATSTIPIVMATIGDDPVTLGLVASYARPGGNVTGIGYRSWALEVKLFELLKETIPRASQVAYLYPSAWLEGRPIALAFKEAFDAADALRLTLLPVGVASAEEFPEAFTTITRQRADAVLVPYFGFNFAHQGLIVDLATRHRLRSFYGFRDAVTAGGLMAYESSVETSYRRAATYVDKILKGAKPADLPIEMDMKYNLVINLKTAKTLGLTIPPSVLARADEIIQ